MERNELKDRIDTYLSRETHTVFKTELEALVDAEDWGELEERFYTDLAFGTGGLRGIIGAGYNRMNPLVVRRATQGFADYIKGNIQAEGASDRPSVAVAYDSRNYSELFAREAASVFCGNGIKTYLFESLRPTPELSFAVRELGATAGIVVTASHNPAAYNGYKVYWSDGGQIVPPHDSAIIECVRNVSGDISVMDLDAARTEGLFEMIGEEVDEAYAAMVKSRVIRPDLFAGKASDLTVVYTPLHGTGALLVEKILGELGVNVITVAEQREPDGDFPTVTFPNPEEAAAMTLALEYGRKHGADLIMGTDPDSDRLGIAVPEDGDFRLITGNQLGSLLADYILSSLAEEKKLPEQPVLVKTIVTTELQRAIADRYGAETVDVLTGFKYIAEVMRKLDGTGKTYVFGGEESYGYLVETEVRDKDAVSAAVLTAELALYERSRGRTVLDRLNDIYAEYGYYEEILKSFTFQGSSGLEKIGGLMREWRENPPAEIAGIGVAEVRDYAEGWNNLPKSNVLQFVLEDGTIVTGRPSGTEPKIKFYASCSGKPGEDRTAAEAGVKEKLEGISGYLASLAE